MKEPTTLQEAVIYFSDPDRCLAYMVIRRWPNGVECPTCGSKEVSFVPSRRVWQCKTRHPKCQFTIKIGTIFEDSPLSLEKWLPVIWMIANCKNGVSSWEIHRAIHVTQKTAWFMLHRVRLAMQDEFLGKIGGGGQEVEVDETYIGGKARNMHKSRRERMIDGRGTAGKVAVMGLLQRHNKGSKVRMNVLSNTGQKDIQPVIHKNVESGSYVYTDSHSGYDGLVNQYFHEFVKSR